jgi:hypothetical protein
MADLLLPLSPAYCLVLGLSSGSLSVAPSSAPTAASPLFTSDDPATCAAVVDWDDARGGRVLLGLEDGSSRILHIAAADAAGGDEDDDLLMTQGATQGAPSPAAGYALADWSVGPRFNLPVRCCGAAFPQHPLVVLGGEESGLRLARLPAGKEATPPASSEFQAASAAKLPCGLSSLCYSPPPADAPFAAAAPGFLVLHTLDHRLACYKVSGPDADLDYELLHLDSQSTLAPALPRDAAKAQKSEDGPALRACRVSVSPPQAKGRHCVLVPGGTKLPPSSPPSGEPMLELRFLRPTDTEDAATAARRVFATATGLGNGHEDVVLFGTFLERDGSLHLLSAGRDGKVCLWSVAMPSPENISGGATYTRTVHACAEGAFATSLLVDGARVHATNSRGEIETFPLTAAEFEPKPAPEDAAADAAEASQEELVEDSAPAAAGKRLAKKAAAAEEDEDDDVFASAGEAAAKPKLADDEEEEAAGAGAGEEDNAEAEQAAADMSLDEVDFGGDDDDDAAAVPSEELEELKDTLASLSSRVDSRFYPPQRPFQPSSTKLEFGEDEETGKPVAAPRYLCWNWKGAATSRYVRGSAVVEVDYTDAAGERRSMAVPGDTAKPFIVGSLGDQGGIFASDLMEDDDEGLSDDEDMAGVSEKVRGELLKEKKQKRREARMKNAKEGQYGGSDVYFHRYDSFGPAATKDWKVTLPRDEVVVCAATGLCWSAVLTSRRFLRLYTNGGMQDEVVWLKGEPVACAGRGR